MSETKARLIWYAHSLDKHCSLQIHFIADKMLSNHSTASQLSILHPHQNYKAQQATSTVFSNLIASTKSAPLKRQ